jgi:hypothetical protein
MRRRTGIIVASVCAAGWLAWAAGTAPAPARQLPPAEVGTFPVVRGAYHIHSLESDGTGSIAEISAAAARAGLDFVILTDHGDATQRTRTPRYYSGVLCVEAVEISTADGHYAALGLPPAPYPLAGEGRDVVEDVARLGGFGIAAHPDSAKYDLQWREWDAPFPALEWFNGDSQWRDEERWRLPPSLIRYLRRPAETVAALFDRPDPLLARWDALTQQRRVVALAGHDAHQRLGLRSGMEPGEQRLYLEAPAYEHVFRSLTTGVELPYPFREDAGVDSAVLIEAIRAGRVFTAVDAVATPARFQFTATVGEQSARMGDRVPLTGPIAITVRSNAPDGSTVVLFRNGQAIDTRQAPHLEWFGDGPGVYRVEISVPGAPGHPPVPWVLSNPIYIGVNHPSPDAPRLADGTTWPAVDWRVEKNAGSGVTLAQEPSGQQGPGVAFDYTLGEDTANPFVAVVTADLARLREAELIAFRVSAAAPMRASVQIRAASDDPDERWRRSFYADREPRTITIPLADFTPVVAGLPDTFPRDRLGVLMFVVDVTNARPGDRGQLRIDTIRTGR